MKGESRHSLFRSQCEKCFHHEDMACECGYCEDCSCRTFRADGREICECMQPPEDKELSCKYFKKGVHYGRP